MVQTRLQIQKERNESNQLNQLKQMYKVNIDFDEASREWHANKKSIGNSQYKYICQIISNTGKQCGKVCYKNEAHCWPHRKTKCFSL